MLRLPSVTGRAASCRVPERSGAADRLGAMRKSHRTPPRPVRAAQGLLTALVGLLLVLAGIVVGAVPAAAQNAVGASNPAAANAVGPPADITAGQRLGKVVPRPRIVVATGVAAKTLSGSGPVPGVLEASGRVKSFAALRNYNPKGGVEYVFDPATGTFAVGRPAVGAGLKGSPHEQLAQSIGANPSTVVGGTLTRGGNGAFITTEQSGHFWQNWTPEIRQQFVGTMRGYGLDVVH